MKRLISVLLGLMVLSACTSVRPGKGIERTAVIPQPVFLKEGVGEFTVTPRTVIVSDPEAADTVKFLTADFRIAAGFTLKKAERAETNVIRFLKADENFAEKGPEAYMLDVSVDAVEIRANGPSGFFYAYQTLKQLLPPAVYAGMVQAGVSWTVPVVSVEDYPRFEWRGLMLDCSRHFFDTDSVKRFIDLMAIHKFNKLHWHLTDDQGWRLEIKKYPLLTEVGSKRERTLKGHYLSGLKGGHKYDNTPHGGYYTQDEARDIVRYAAARGITVVPEIELPGHAQAAIAAYPWLGVSDVPDEKLIAAKADTSCFFNCPNCIQGNNVKVSGIWGVSPRVFKPAEKTAEFLKDVLTEVMDIFPSEFIHIGGDECAKGQWKLSEEVQAFIREKELGNENGAQSWFVHQMDEFLTAHGRRLIGWDEILDGGLAPNATVMSWRGKAGGIRAAKMHHDIVMTPTTFVYLDYHQEAAPYNQLGIGGYLPLKKVYSFDPVGAALAGKYEQYVLGGQANIWTEYIKTIDQVEFMGYPRAAAVAEAVWSPKHKKSFSYFCVKLSRHLQRLAAMDVNFCIPSKGKKAAAVDFSGTGDYEVDIPGLDGAVTVQVYLVPANGSSPAVAIPNAKLSSEYGIGYAERPECRLFDGIAQAGVFTFHMQEPVGGGTRLVLTVSDAQASGTADIYVKCMDADGTCR